LHPVSEPDLEKYARRYTKGIDGPLGLFLMEIKVWADTSEQARYMLKRYAERLYDHFRII
jgi:hypothetical protein